MSVRSLRYNTIEQHFTKGVTASTDRDALSFLEAAQIYNANQQRAIVNLVRSLKRVGLWSKMKAIYPFVGGTATSHKFNLKDPRDVDAAFRLEFGGGYTHNSNGITGNGTNTYADTNLKPENDLSNVNSTHVSIYFRNDRSNNGIGIGARDTIADAGGIDIWRWSDNHTYFAINSLEVQGDNVVTKGFYNATRTQSDSMRLIRNGIKVVTSATNVSRLPNNFAIIGAYGVIGGTLQYWDNSNVAFATIGDGLTDTDASNLYNIVDLYQKRLGRAV